MTKQRISYSLFFFFFFFEFSYTQNIYTYDAVYNVSWTKKENPSFLSTSNIEVAVEIDKPVALNYHPCPSLPL